MTVELKVDCSLVYRAIKNRGWGVIDDYGRMYVYEDNRLVVCSRDPDGINCYDATDAIGKCNIEECMRVCGRCKEFLRRYARAGAAGMSDEYLRWRMADCAACMDWCQGV